MTAPLNGRPSGTVTFLLTDVEGSTRLWEEHTAAMQVAMARHDVLLRAAVEARGGHVVKTTGDGLLAAFATAEEALLAAIDGALALSAEHWELPESIRARVGIHTGPAEQRDGDYFGPTLNRAARLMSLGHGGQVLLSQTSYDLVRDALSADVTLLDVGEHRMKDLLRAERVYQVVAPGLATEFPPLRSLDRRRHNLPVERVPLIGRERELAAARDRLLTPETGLLTLTGPGGTGKTRLALQLAAEVVDDFEHGVLLVQLAPVTDPTLVLGAIAQVLGVEEARGRLLGDAVAEYLAAKSLLLVLDNFEQVLNAALVVGELLQGAPRLKVLATSRAPLRIRGEREYSVPPLAMPERGKAVSPEGLSQYEAVRLFVQRAQDSRPEFSVTNENAPAVAEICHRLDGLPLAIELAAARVKVLAPQALLERLERRLPMLTGGARDLPARQQTLRNAIAWSYELLDEAEKALFRRLAVFVGGCTLEAAEEVCGGEPVGSVLDGLSGLLDKNLVRRQEVDGETRFLMLETIREFAREQLTDTMEEGAIRGMHAGHFMALADKASPAPFLMPPQALEEWRARVDREIDNARAALMWTAEAPERAEIGLRLASGFSWSWIQRHQFREIRHWIDLLLASGPASPSVRAAALAALAWAAEGLGERLAARTYGEESLAIRRTVGDQIAVGMSLLLMSVFANDDGDHGRARAIAEESLAIARQLDLKPAIALILNNLGWYAITQGDSVAAMAYFREGLPIAREAQVRRILAETLHSLGELLRGSGQLTEAHDAYEEALSLFQALGEPGLSTVWCLHGLGKTVLQLGDLRRASVLLRESLTLAWEFARDVGSKTNARQQVGLALAGLGSHAASVGMAERGAASWPRRTAVSMPVSTP